MAQLYKPAKMRSGLRGSHARDTMHYIYGKDTEPYLKNEMIFSSHYIRNYRHT